MGQASKKNFNPDTVNMIIGPESNIQGNLHSQGSIRIEGIVTGEIVSEGEVFIGEGSVCNASINATRVVIAGQVFGNVEATKGIKICATGKVEGNITGDRLIVEEGGVYKGQVNMDVISSRNLYEGKFEVVSA